MPERESLVSHPPPTEDLPALELRDGPAPVIDSLPNLERYAALLADGDGPVALDAERASGYRYSQRAYLVQVRREGAGTALIDPIAVPDLGMLNEAIGEAEWILHAATQDLACLDEVGLKPARLFDTEVAGRLLGRDRVSLAALVASELNQGLAKGQGATDWSARPLSAAQLRYAALDVEPLVELRDILESELRTAGRWTAAQQEFTHLLGFRPRDRGPEPWRRLSGLHKVRKPRQLAVARSLWNQRDAIAAERDVAPGRLVPDSAIVAAALGDPQSPRDLLELDGFHGRGAARYKNNWWGAIVEGRGVVDADLPQRSARPEGPPPPRSWPDRHPAAHARFTAAKQVVGAIADEWGIAVELVLPPEALRRVCWEPPTPLTPETIDAALLNWQARPWQRDLCRDPLLAALATEVTSE